MNRHKRGLLIGPEESLDRFNARSSLPSISHFPEKLKKQFGICPDWVPVIYQNKGLRFWEGGCSWIDDSQVMIQLRHSFKERSSLWGLYSKEELLNHEAVHAARIAFNEPVFEEVFAYQTSKSAWRRYFGPIFRSPTESLVFVLSASLLPFASFFPSLYLFVFTWVFSISAFGLFRLMSTQRKFRSALQKLTKLFGSSALGVMLHLTDKEIILCAKSSLKNIEAFFAMEASPRFEQIRSECGVELYSQSQALSDI